MFTLSALLITAATSFSNTTNSPTLSRRDGKACSSQLTCPIDNGCTATSPRGDQYLVTCNTDFYGGDLQLTQVRGGSALSASSTPSTTPVRSTRLMPTAPAMELTADAGCFDTTGRKPGYVVRRARDFYGGDLALKTLPDLATCISACQGLGKGDL
ncbi:hypothetical protein PSPO01_12952 [Paraphaeosphaeria sporulosa]